MAVARFCFYVKYEPNRNFMNKKKEVLDLSKSHNHLLKHTQMNREPFSIRLKRRATKSKTKRTKVILLFTPSPGRNLSCRGNGWRKNWEELFTWFTAIINCWTGYLNVIYSSREPSSSARCNNNARTELWTLGLLSQRQHGGFFLKHISGANKEMRMNRKTFLTGKEPK